MAKFTGSFRGIGEMLKSPEMVAAMEARVEKAKAFAENIAPKATGSFAEHFSTSSTRTGGVKHDRAAAYLINDDPAAFHIEYGTSDTPAHRTLRRSIDAMGDV